MEIIKLNINEVIPYSNNPRKNDNAVDAVAESIKQCGYCSPIVIDEDNVILAGHTRLKALKKLKWKEVECVRKTGLTEEQKKKYRILDNKTNELAEWDFDLLEEEIDGMDFDGFDFGFEFNSGEDDAEIIEDEVPEVNEEIEPTVKLGDIWQLGEHRLMCGDSTDEDFVDFLEKALMPCETMYVCCSWQNSHLFRQAIENIGQKIKAMIVWDKVNPAQHLDKYFKQHEIIWYCGAFGGEKTLRGDVWQCKRQKNTVHPTMKPLELIGMALQDQPKKKTVYDGFGGSGSTLIACEQLDRTCYMMELDPKYCDVIIKRWETFTGKKAVKIN